MYVAFEVSLWKEMHMYKNEIEITIAEENYNAFLYLNAESAEWHFAIGIG